MLCLTLTEVIVTIAFIPIITVLTILAIISIITVITSVLNAGAHQLFWNALQVNAEKLPSGQTIIMMMMIS